MHKYAFDFMFVVYNAFENVYVELLFWLAYNIKRNSLSVGNLSVCSYNF